MSVSQEESPSFRAGRMSTRIIADVGLLGLALRYQAALRTVFGIRTN